MATVATTEIRPRSRDEAPSRGRGGARATKPVQRASAMTRGSTTMSAIGQQPVADLEGKAFENLLRVGGPGAQLPVACLRIADRDLVICDGAGVVLYTLQLTATTASWQQRAVSYPPEAELRQLREHPHWAERARDLALTSTDAHVSRVAVGVVAAEARGAQELGELFEGEESVYRLSEAASALLQSSGKQAAKSGRLLMADVERARYPSHVPLRRLQGALAEELAFGHSVAAICSRSPWFSESAEERKVRTLLCLRLGIQGTFSRHGLQRYSRVATTETAELLCEALDLAPERVGL